MASQSLTKKPAYKEDKKQSFLEAFARIGTICGAADAVDIHRDTVYSWRKQDPAFKDSLERADAALTDTLESVMHEKALKGDTTALIFLLKARKPQKYTVRYRHEIVSKQFSKLIGLMTSVLKRVVPQPLWPKLSTELEAAANTLELGQPEYPQLS